MAWCNDIARRLACGTLTKDAALEEERAQGLKSIRGARHRGGGAEWSTLYLLKSSPTFLGFPLFTFSSSSSSLGGFGRQAAHGCCSSCRARRKPIDELAP
eukprot:736397-Pyramimonas_sp.AAC.1